MYCGGILVWDSNSLPHQKEIALMYFNFTRFEVLTAVVEEDLGGVMGCDAL
jgi:hypothetical protein